MHAVRVLPSLSISPYTEPLLASQQTANPNTLIEHATLGALKTLRRLATPGASQQSINRVTARILNSFEEGRIQAKAFYGVQELTTLGRYAKYWSGLIVFLLHAIDNDSDGPFSSYYFDSNPRLRELVQRVNDRLDALLAMDLKDIEFDKLFSMENEGSDNEEDIPVAVRLHAKALYTAVERLSFFLVRFRFEESSFVSPVVGYMALRTLESNGSWIPAHNFTSVISSIIHCMQLWLLGYCYQAKALAAPLVTLQTIVREQCKRFLVNTTPTPLAELSCWRLLTWTASNDTVRHPVTTINAACTQVTHLGIELEVPAWQRALQDLLGSAEALLRESLLLDLPEVPKYDVARLVDTSSDSCPGKSFLDDHRNGLHAVDDYLFKQVRGDPTLLSRFFLPSPPQANEASSSSSVRVRHAAVNSYFHANQQFLQQLAVLCYWGSGLPPRRKELVRIQWCNTEVARNIYILDGLVVIISGYHKTKWRIGTRPIARFLPPVVGNLLIRYLIYIPSFIRFLYSCMQYPPCKGYLFSDEHGVWSSDRLGNYVKRHSARLLGFQITTRNWRHIAIAIDRRMYAGRACKVYGVSQHWDRRALHAVDHSDSELDPEYHMQDDGDSGLDTSTLSRARNFQASHTPATNQAVYGNDTTLMLGLTDALLAAYREVSQFWYRSIACLDSIASNHKRNRSVESQSHLPVQRLGYHRGSSLKIRRQIWQWPEIEKGLQRLFGPHAAPRNLDQRNGFLMVARSRPESIIVLPTGGGKSLLFLVASQLPGAQVTIVVVPLIALRHDLRQ